MGVGVSTGFGSGRGSCAWCNAKIAKGEPQIVAQGWRDSSRYHVHCVIKDIMIQEREFV
jgi:hypothetical protein